MRGPPAGERLGRSLHRHHQIIMRRLLGYLTLSLLVLNTGCLYYAAPKAGRLYLSGRYADLEQSMEEKIARGETLETEENSYLCGAYWMLRKYGELMACSEQMEKNLQKGKFSKSWMWDAAYAFLWVRARASIELGNYPQAIEEAARACKIGEENNLDSFHQAYSLSALSLAYALNGDRANALKYAGRLKNVNTLNLNYRSLETEKSIELAKIYMALGEFDQALDVMKHSKEPKAVYKTFANILYGSFWTGQSLFTYQKLPRSFMFNKALLETGKIQEAKKGYDQLLKNPRIEYNRDIYWLALFDRGRIAEKEGNLPEAIRFYEKAVSVIEEQRSTINAEASRIGYVGDKQQVYHRLIAALFSAARQGQAFEYVERAKSRALVDLLASKKKFAVRKGDEKEIQAILDQLDSLQAEGLIQENKSGSRGISQRRRLDFETKEKLKAKAPELASLVTVTPVSIAEIQSQLRPDETLVEYYYADEDLYAFLLTRESVKAVSLNGRGLLTEIQGLRASLEDPGTDDYNIFSEGLYQKLIKPLEPLLATPNLILVPHGALHYLPFNALKEAGEYLIDRYSLRYLPSASVMNHLAGKDVKGRETLMAVGNPLFQGEKQALSYAEEEVRSVAKTFPQSTILVGKDATETSFKKISRSFNYIHLATHGVFEADNPLNSGLLLTLDRENDGILSAAELYSLELDADLLTLSACETGLSQISNGDDLVGLTRGFLYAGSRAIVASLWSVDDKATAELMTQFYANLKTMNKRDALREAQRAIKTKYGHPFYWAAFQLTGRA